MLKSIISIVHLGMTGFEKKKKSLKNFQNMLNFLGESAGKKSERMKNIEKFRECKAPGIGSSRIFHVIDFRELGRNSRKFLLPR